MAKERQLNPFGENYVSLETCLDQLNKAPAERTIVGMNKKDKIVVGDDRVLFLKHKRDGIMNEWVEVFTKDVKALEINTPGQCKLFQKKNVASNLLPSCTDFNLTLYTYFFQGQLGTPSCGTFLHGVFVVFIAKF